MKPLPKPQVESLTLRDLILPLLLIAVIVFSENYSLLILAIGFLLINFLVVAVHELGHVVAGWSVGLHLQSVKVGPLRIERESCRWKLRTRRHLMNGFTYMSLDRLLHVRRRLIIFTAGGPLASFFTGLIALLALSLLDNSSFLQPFLGWFGVFSLLISILTLVPARVGEHTNDGLKLRTLIRSKEGTKQLIAVHALLMLKNRDIKLAQCNQRWIKLACLPGEMMQSTYYADWLAYSANADSSHAVAAQHLERCLAASGVLDSGGRDVLILEATVFNAWYRDDATKADIWFKRAVLLNQIKPYLRMRAQIALYCAHRQFDEALKEYETALVVVQQLPTPQFREYQASWIKWREEIEQRKNQNRATIQAASQ